MPIMYIATVSLKSELACQRSTNKHNSLLTSVHTMLCRSPSKPPSGESWFPDMTWRWTSCYSINKEHWYNYALIVRSLHILWEGCVVFPFQYSIPGNFHWVRYHALKAYFRGLIFVIPAEHIIIVAYNYGLIFRFGALSVTKIKPNEIFPWYVYVYMEKTNHSVYNKIKILKKFRHYEHSL